jgi:hypothetical protein
MPQQWRMRPPPTQQSSLTCWAAAISSFSRVTRDVTDWATADAVLKHFKAAMPTQLNKDSLKTPQGWVAFAHESDLEVEEIRINDPLTGTAPAASAGITSIAVDELSPSNFLGKLKRSHVIVVTGTDIAAGLSHTLLVYGADNLRLCFMDPLQDPNASVTDTRPAGGSGRVAENWFCETYEDFQTAPRYLLIWRG